jgi:hypothetical protein
MTPGSKRLVIHEGVTCHVSKQAGNSVTSTLGARVTPSQIKSKKCGRPISQHFQTWEGSNFLQNRSLSADRCHSARLHCIVTALAYI